MMFGKRTRKDRKQVGKNKETRRRRLANLMSRRPQVESLEDRRLLAVVLQPTTGTVSNAVADGDQYFDSGGIGGSTTASDQPGNYANSENGVLTLDAGVGNVLQVDFTAFQLETNSPSGPPPAYDYLNVFDGSSTAATSIGSFESATPSLPGTITATGNALTFEFISDSIVNARVGKPTSMCLPKTW